MGFSGPVPRPALPGRMAHHPADAGDHLRAFRGAAGAHGLRAGDPGHELEGSARGCASHGRLPAGPWGAAGRPGGPDREELSGVGRGLSGHPGRRRGRGAAGSPAQRAGNGQPDPLRGGPRPVRRRGEAGGPGGSGGLPAPFPGAGPPELRPAAAGRPGTPRRPGGNRHRRHPVHLGHHRHAQGRHPEPPQPGGRLLPFPGQPAGAAHGRVLRPDAHPPLLHHDRGVPDLRVLRRRSAVRPEDGEQAHPGGPEARPGDHVPRGAHAFQPPADRHPQGPAGKGPGGLRPDPRPHAGKRPDQEAVPREPGQEDVRLPAEEGLAWRISASASPGAARCRPAPSGSSTSSASTSCRATA